MHKYMTVKMPDGSVFGVPVEMVARNRAAHYAHEFNGDIERSLKERTPFRCLKAMIMRSTIGLLTI